MTMRLPCVLLSCALTAALAGAPAVAQYEAPVLLDATHAAAGSLAWSVTRDGDRVVGWGQPSGGGWSRPVLWAGGPTVFLPVLAGDEAGYAWGANDSGRVVGESVDVVPQGQLTHLYSKGVFWDGGPAQPLASLVTGGDTDLVPFAGLVVNHLGRILGQGKRDGINGLRGFVLDGGILTDLGSLAGTLTGSTEPLDMNEQGTVTGSSEVTGGFDHAFTWAEGTLTDLHTASGVPGRNSHARAINEWGLVVGSADPTADFIDFEQAATWQGGVLHWLPNPGGQQSFAHDVNDHGTIVGTVITPAFDVHAAMWRDDVLFDLNDLIPPGSGWVLGNAYGISNDGRIVGEGFSPSGLQAFELVPDCGGGFEVLAAGCAGSGGFVPGLWGEGCPQGGGTIRLALTNGAGGGQGLLLVGLGGGTAAFKGCTLSVLPLTPLNLSLPLTPGGAGAGQWGLAAQLPASLSTGSLYLQALLPDAGVPGGATASNPLRMDLAP